MSIKTFMTADELMQLPDDGNRYELVKGELKQMAPAGGEHGATAADFTVELGYYIKKQRLGRIFAAETGFKISSDPDTVRAPDFAFVSKDRIPLDGIPKGYFPFAPDLVVEVISPNDIYTEVEDKVLEWLDAGTRMVIVINPRKQIITVYRSFTEVTILKQTETLSGGDVIPGFSCPVSEIFS